MRGSAQDSPGFLLDQLGGLALSLLLFALSPRNIISFFFFSHMVVGAGYDLLGHVPGGRTLEQKESEREQQDPPPVALF